MNFKNIIKEFTNITHDSKLGIYMIHLSKATERLPIIKSLEEKLNITLPIFEAKNGDEFINNGYSREDLIIPYFNRTAGELGCMMSHYYLYCDALEKNYEYIVIFEDDCMFNKNLEELSDFLKKTKEYFLNTNENWDLFALGALENTNFDIKTEFLLKTFGFHGTHAFIIKKSFYITTITIINQIISNKKMYPIDSLLSYIIRLSNLNAFCHIDPHYFFTQKEGIYSYVIEDIRNHNI